MTNRPRKHSLTLRGHRTSVSLEDEFWQAFREIAAEDNRAINDLAAEIDENRGVDCGLASAIRLHVLRRLRKQRVVSSDAQKPT
ncbi:ribbon-helix-helix domain-containing protein [Phaeobacter porticola]|uniref:Ribbon-helix-helix domain protein n=1 Tax=Phaeobacter porticola TaxID=1844006 RepID=A0A1L3I439_9RHOB|nr:ribbon-helix-helix domain-containing protein [Phaeobacter porticola]APG46772.1 Ribbon-helix-helix domain protein [Phaeobacter porticola]